VIATTPDKSLTVSDLALNGEYFWQIDRCHRGRHGLPQAPSRVSGHRQPGMIDDMEMYRPRRACSSGNTGSTVSTTTTNGSVVGNGDEAEKTVVFEGSQSLPMAYDNTSAPLSEATRFFDTAVDLTVGIPRASSCRYAATRRDSSRGTAP
jgi:hypothetical protein